MATELAVFLALSLWISKTYVADEVARNPTLENLQLALRLDPNNSDYLLRLGRVFQYNLPDVDPDRATENLQRAAQLNPHEAQGWVALAAAFELRGQIKNAESCLRRADLLAPNVTDIQWSIANFFLLEGNVREAFPHFRTVLAGSSKYDQVIFNLGWKASGNASEILGQLIPGRVSTELGYLYYLLSKKRYSECESVWKRIANSSESFPASYVAAYIEGLIQARRPTDAYHVWTDLIAKGLIKPTYMPTGPELLVNGDFEEDVLNMGFDWHIRAMQGVFAGVDQTVFHSPTHSLLVQFLGKENVDYHHVFQYVRAVPGRSYRLRGLMRAEGITTDSGPRLQVRDVYDPTELLKSSEGITGSTTGWEPILLDFTAGKKTELVAVILVRPPSQKLDNLLAGRVWLDDLSLSPLPSHEVSLQR